VAEIYNFTINKRMLIDTWDEPISGLIGAPASEVVGKKYYEVFPKLQFRGKDAVAYAIEKRRKLVLRGYAFHCLLCRVTADITVKPLLKPRGVCGASIEVSNVLTSDGYGPKDVQRFIAMGKTASGLAHSVRNPLNAIKGAVAFVSQKYAREKVITEFAQIMDEEISRLDEFITDFLATSVEEMKPSMVDINAVLRKIEKLIFFQALTQDISCDFRYGSIPPAFINAYQIEQAVLNIINNAMEAIGSDGGVTVKTALEKAPEKDYIVIEVSDDGPGLMTRRTSEDVTGGERGKGYGLAITEETMKRCGGRMDIRSMTDRGTSVSLYIPATGGCDEEKRQG
jgi:two-component system nitrogen regulation sensor histidine kinase GlnL